MRSRSAIVPRYTTCSARFTARKLFACCQVRAALLPVVTPRAVMESLRLIESTIRFFVPDPTAASSTVSVTVVPTNAERSNPSSFNCCHAFSGDS
jgi:hypothetical protein